MAEYIDREAAIAKLTALEVIEPNATMVDAKRQLANMPAADVAPVVHGKDLASPSLFCCSVCGCEDDDTYTCDVNEYRYCPNCGARMDETVVENKE